VSVTGERTKIYPGSFTVSVKTLYEERSSIGPSWKRASGLAILSRKIDLIFTYEPSDSGTAGRRDGGTAGRRDCGTAQLPEP